MNVGDDVFSPNDKESLESSEISDEALKSIYSDVEEMPRPKRYVNKCINNSLRGNTISLIDIWLKYCLPCS